MKRQLSEEIRLRDIQEISFSDARKYMDDARMQLANSCDDVITVSRK